MIRWGYVAPRLFVLALFIGFLAFALDPLARWSLVRTGQAVTGAKVEAGRVSTSPLRSQVSLEDLQIANPSAPERNLLEADYAWLDVETLPLSRRRLIVRQGVVCGLRFNAPRNESGQLDDPVSAGISPEEFRNAGRQWMEEAARALGQNLADDLESVRLARELAERWPGEYRDLETRTDRWLEQVRQLQQLPELLQGDLLADADRIRKAALTMKLLRDELGQLRGEFQRLHQQARIDRTDLAAAAQRDVQRIEQRLRLAKLEPEVLTEYLLGPELGPQVQRTLVWMQNLRGRIPGGDLPPPQRRRGIDIPLGSPHREPWLLLRSLRADGEIVWDDSRLPFVAMASGWTTEPAIYGRPAVIRMKTTEPVESWIEVSLDRTQNTPIDRVTVLCPNLRMPGQTLGEADRLALELPPGPIFLQASVTLRGEALWGEVRLRRSNVALNLTLSDELEQTSLAARVQDHLDSIHHIDVRVAISGTLARPQAELHSPLGKQLQTVVVAALQDELEHRRERLEGEVRLAVDAEIERFRERIAMRKQAIMKKLALADRQQKQLEQLVAASTGLSKQRLGRELLRALHRR